MSSVNESFGMSQRNLTSADEEEFHPTPLPVDADGFIVSFRVDQEEELAEFFAKHGAVVVANVLSDDECRASVDEVWRFLQEMFNPAIERDRPESWSSFWPGLSQMGILANERWLSTQACNNRQNPKIYRVFQTLFNDEELIVNIGRAGLMRPTKDVYFPTIDKKEDRKEWKTLSHWLHLDMNPLTGRSSTYGFEHVAEGPFESSRQPLEAQRLPTNNGLTTRKLQAILALVDCREEDGGFHAVPGFQHHLVRWAEKNHQLCLTSNRGGDPCSIQIRANDSMREGVQRMPIRQGSLLVWDTRLPHGNYPNNSDRMRIIQYLHMAPITDRALRPFPLLREDLPHEFHLTELGEKLYGFQPWSSDLARQRFEEERNPHVTKEAEHERQSRQWIKHFREKNKTETELSMKKE